jgi:hypothetical protein
MATTSWLIVSFDASGEFLGTQGNNPGRFAMIEYLTGCRIRDVERRETMDGALQLVIELHEWIWPCLKVDLHDVTLEAAH